MTWIETVPYEKSSGALRELYDRVKGPDNNVDNIMLAHSLRPHSMVGHMAIYKNVLHHRENTIGKWFLETIGVWVSRINVCDYCVEHHQAGLKRLLKDDLRYTAISSALQSKSLEGVFDAKEYAALRYAETLTSSPASITEIRIVELRQAGWTDGEILEINQVVAYFNYANRTVLGLGVSTAGDLPGLSPSDSSDSENWSHQ